MKKSVYFNKRGEKLKRNNMTGKVGNLIYLGSAKICFFCKNGTKLFFMMREKILPTPRGRINKPF